MPIRPEMKSRCPRDWALRSHFVRHLHDKRPEAASLLNLAALCQRCHNRHDRKDRAAGRRERAMAPQLALLAVIALAACGPIDELEDAGPWECTTADCLPVERADAGPVEGDAGPGEAEWSCLDRCNMAAGPGDPCGCDLWCGQPGELPCCPDLEEVCGPGQPGDGDGDGDGDGPTGPGWEDGPVEPDSCLHRCREHSETLQPGWCGCAPTCTFSGNCCDDYQALCR